jgi:hypothetical protein
MFSVQPCEIPGGTLLYQCRQDGAWADCYVTSIARSVSLAEFVSAFYTSSLFKVERRILATFVAKPSTDAQAGELALGTRDAFAAWNVEDRRADELLLRDFQGRTRSWLMVADAKTDASPCTRLYFGSAMGPVANRATGQATLGMAFRALLGFHNIYSQALLRAASGRLIR